MKKYTKPQIMFEDFSLSTSIATCDVEANSVKGSCGYQDPELDGATVFMSKAEGCAYTAPPGYDKVCYDIPYDNNDLFGS